MSLHVQPNDPSFDAVFGSDLDKIAMVKNEDGQVYLPGEDIEQITTWESDESYRIYAEEAFQFDISGTAVSPGSTPVRLETGGNFVPFLLSTSSAVEDALTSISETVVSVEDGQGNTYAPGQTSSGLDSLRAGQGYKVYVDRADTLRYPVTVNTLADARALTGLQAGQLINVRGYHEQGDGGGGMFEVTNSACETDGGTCFVFDEDVSTEQSLTLSVFDLRENYQLPDSNLVYGTVVMGIEYEGDSIDNLLNKRHWHYQKFSNNFDRKSGTIGTGNGINAGPWQGEVDLWFTGDANNPVDYPLRYKYATTDRRLERTSITDAVNLKWWGAVEADPQDPVNNWWRLNKAIRVAADLRESNNLNWAYVDIPGRFYYKNRVTLRDGVMLRGDSETQISISVDGRPTYGELKLMPDNGEFHPAVQLKDGHDTVEGGTKGGHHGLNIVAVDMKTASSATKIGVKQLELDGNIDGNQGPIQDPNDEYDGVDDRLQNANVWNGIVGPSEAPKKSVEAHLKDVYIHDYPGNGIAAGNRFNLTPSQYVRVAEAPSNHQTYHAGRGTYQDWTIEGSGWDVLFRHDSGTAKNFTVQNVKEGTFWTVFGKRWSAVFDHESRFQDTSDWVADGFEVDLSGGNNQNVRVVTSSFEWQDAPADGEHGVWKNGTIYGLPNNITNLLSPRAPTSTPVGGLTFDNITLIDQGGGVGLLSGKPTTHVRFRNITVRAASGVSTPHSFGISFTPFISRSAPTPQAGRIEIENLTTEDKINKTPINAGTWRDGDLPYNILLSNSNLKNNGSQFIGTYGGFSREGVKKSLNAMRTYMSGTQVESGQGFNKNLVHSNYKKEPNIEQRPLKLRNVTDQNGRTSEDSGSYTSDAGDEGNDYVLIPTNLIAYAFETETTLSGSPSGISAITSVENANADGTVRPDDDTQPAPYLKVNLDGTIGSGETVTVDWTARVTPLSEFSTTGLFIPRPVSNQPRYQTSFTSGNGPWTLDLRGVAACMEDDSKIVYSASSGDTSVVTANVQSDDYTLELTEQSGGTATITVTGEIPGVGTASTTFEVVVE